jgi:hypothetical protein
MTRLARLILKSFLAVTALAAGCATLFYLTDRDGWNKRAYDRIRPGMSRAELAEALGDRPDCVVSVGPSEAWFYRGALGEVRCLDHVARAEELPTLYGTLQILVGPDGRVTAVAMDGERPLKTAKGAHFASTLESLPRFEAETP